MSMYGVLSRSEILAIRHARDFGNMTTDQKDSALNKLLAHLCPPGKEWTNFGKGAKVLIRMNGQLRSAEILGFQNGFYSAKIFPLKRGKIVTREYIAPNLIIG